MDNNIKEVDDNKKNNNNKLVGILIVIVVILLLVIAFLVGGDSSNSSKLSSDSETIISNLQTESASVKDGEKGNFAEKINISRFDELINQTGGKNLVLVARPTCSYCELFEPIVKKAIKDYNLTVYYLNTDNFSDDDVAKFISYNSDWSDGFGTPIFLLVGDGKLIDYIDGATDTAHLKEFLKGHKFIKE